jgi:phenylacetate-CoA ligase
MSTQIILKVLALRRRLRQRDRWTRLQLEEHQDRALHRLREHAYVRSLFYLQALSQGLHRPPARRPADPDQRDGHGALRRARY